LVPQNPESMPQDSLTYTKLGIPDSTPPESALILTTIIFIVYATVTRPVMPQTVEELQSVPPIVMQAFTTWISAFFFSTFLTLLLTTVYSVSLVLLIFFNFLGTRTYMRWLVPENLLSIIRWMLPVETLPVRSIGIVAGAFLFLFLAVFHALS
jgi:hypothetical protein